MSHGKRKKLQVNNGEILSLKKKKTIQSYKICCHLDQMEQHFQNCLYGSEDSRLRASDLAKGLDLFSDTGTLREGKTRAVKAPARLLHQYD